MHLSLDCGLSHAMCEVFHVCHLYQHAKLGRQSTLDFEMFGFKICRLGILNLYFLIIFQVMSSSKLCIVF